MSLATLLSKKAILQAAETNPSASPFLEQTSILEFLKHCSYFFYLFIYLFGKLLGPRGLHDCASRTAWGGGKKALIQQQVTLPTIWVFTLQSQFAIAGQMCQTCCLGFSRHRQEGGISPSCPCKEALVMFTNLLIEAKQNGGTTQLQTTEDSWPSIPPLLRSLHVPTTSLTWENPKPRLLEEANLLSPSGIIAMPAASSVQTHPDNSPSVTRYLSQIPNSGIPQVGYNLYVLPISECAPWGRTVQMLFGGTFSPAI